MDYLPQGHSDAMKLLSLKQSMATSIINAGLKADENRFRRRNNDVLSKLFEAVKADKKLVIESVAH